jgi:hypothetical protein
MKKIKISLVLLGSLKYPLNIHYLEQWKSEILSIQRGSLVGHLPDAEGQNWDYPDSQLLALLTSDADCDFTVGVINSPLEDNYYIRRLSERVAVMSLHEMADIVRRSECSLEQYILRNIYEMAVLYAANGKLLPTEYGKWAHDEVRGCLFDMNSTKADIVFSLHRPSLCPACRTRISSKQVPAVLLTALNDELPRIQKPLFFRMSDAIKRHPVIALLITAIFGVALNLIASIIFEKAKHAFPWLG